MNNDYMFEDEDNMDFKSQESEQNQQNNANFAGEQYGQYTGPKYSYQDPGYKPESDGLGMAVVSMVLGVGSIMFFILGINIICSIISIILGIVFLAKSSNKLGRIFSITGIITAVLGIVCCIAAWSFIFSNADNIAGLADDKDGMEEWYEYYGLDGMYNDIAPYDDDNNYIFEDPDGDDLSNLFDGKIDKDEHPDVDFDDTL
ncbi:hypothetical protein [Pseudobutyrivibrio sp.]|uniref:hypothetical protein n=1 Tax=Pseudobutyrivibrio sp. TaxID=2014367 RepID=UPI001B42BF7F|nr:hypothetical protein [Pseudobutyrivibrio sp.]MBP3262186.1 hypothetical protein [Pseudobutyrivibrio sp.]